ncbi:MAG: ADP compounds hydrolase NudE [Coxiellaceae bacterium]|nr:ADP compounds hydrolase NudE [Coxiellaceae bacterium]|tara:strand:+ start:1235 stop:1801 length:567 start_codon:yes stop_codon:yes gene_type:complete
MIDQGSRLKTTCPDILNTSCVAKTELFTVEKVHLKFSNGVQREYERFSGTANSSVIIIPILADEVLLVREYAVGMEQYVLQFPAGRIDVGETPEQAASRELMEEVGYDAKHLSTLKKTAISPSYSSALSYLVLAEELHPKQLQGDEPEPLEVVPWRLDQLDTLLEDPDFIGARSIAALFYLYRRVSAA